MGSALSCSSKGALLHVLAANGDVATAQELLKKHPKAALYTNFKDRSSPLIQAAARGHFELLQTILETAVMVEGPDKAKRLCIDHRNAKRQTALSVACKHGHADCVEYLVTNGADPLVADARRHNTCLHFAALYGHTECVHKLLGTRATLQQQGRPTTVSQLLCHDGDGSTVTRFIDRHNGWGLSALHIAVFQGSVNTVRALLRHGASLDSVIVAAEIENSPIRCAVGSNALHIAALVGNISMAKVILEAQESVPGLELRSRTDAAGLRPGEYAQRARNPVLVHLLDERLPVSLLRQIWMNYSLEQSMPPRHQTLGAMLQKLKLMFNLELIAVQRNLAASAQEASDAAAAAAGGAVGVGRASSAGPTNHSVSAHLLRSSSTTAGTRRSTTADSPMLSADQYQQVQQRALWLKRQEEVQVLLQSVTQLHVTLQELCRRAEDGSSTEWPGGSSSSQEAVLDFILSTLITPRTVSAIVYAAKKLVCSNVMAVVAANPTGSSTPTLPAEVDVQHGIALLSTALRAVETCLQAASHLSNPAALAAEPVAALADAARAAAAQQAGDEGAAPAAAPAPAEDGPAVPTTAPGASAPVSGAAADPPSTAPERQAATVSGGVAAPVSPGAAGAVPPALASIPAGVPPSSPFLSSHWSAHLHSVIAQLHWDIGVQRHRRRRQHAAQQAARAAAAAAAASNAVVAAEPHAQDLSLLPGRAPVPSSSQATMRQRRRQSGRSVARSTGQMPAPSVTGDSTQPTAFMPGSGMLQSPAAGGAHAGSISPQGSQPPSFRQADGSEGMLLRSLSIRSAEASNPPDLATPGSGGARSVSTGRNVMDGSAIGEILPQYTDAASCRPEGPSQVSGSGVSLAACTQQRTACSSDKRSVDQGTVLGELSEDLSGGEEDAGSMWSDDDSMLCSICMDQPVAVQVTGCQHGLCVQCAFQLTVKGRELPSCPFCRQKIPAFEARPTDAAGANAAASPAGAASLPKAA